MRTVVSELSESHQLLAGNAEIETEPAAFFQIILCGNLERGTLAHRALPGQGSATADKRTVSILV
jgi:hypothetical protein